MAQRAALVAGVPAQVLTTLLPRDERRAARRRYGRVRRLPPLRFKTTLKQSSQIRRPGALGTMDDQTSCPALSAGACLLQSVGLPHQ